MLTTEYKAALAALVAAEADIKGLKDAIKALGADAALMRASMLPPPFGTAADIVSLGVSLGRGDWGGAFWGAVGIIPIVGDGAKAAAKGTRAAKQLKAIKKAIAKGEQIIAKKKDDLAKLCKKNRVGKNKVRQAAKESDCEVCGREPKNGVVGVKNPHPGLHNRDDLTLGKQDKFKTIRKIDMDNLSDTDEIAAKALKDQGWENKKIKEILSSGDSFRVKELIKGDKLYGIGTEGYSKNIKTSSYWLDEAGYNKVKDKFYKDGHWDKEGVKNNLALPCFNKANRVDQAVLTESHTVVESTIGKATELIQYKGDDSYSTGLLGKIMGGGGTQIANDPTKIKSIP